MSPVLVKAVSAACVFIIGLTVFVIKGGGSPIWRRWAEDIAGGKDRTIEEVTAAFLAAKPQTKEWLVAFRDWQVAAASIRRRHALIGVLEPGLLFLAVLVSVTAAAGWLCQLPEAQALSPVLSDWARQLLGGCIAVVALLLFPMGWLFVDVYYYGLPERARKAAAERAVAGAAPSPPASQSTPASVQQTAPSAEVIPRQPRVPVVSGIDLRVSGFQLALRSNGQVLFVQVRHLQGHHRLQVLSEQPLCDQVTTDHFDGVDFGYATRLLEARADGMRLYELALLSGT